MASSSPTISSSAGQVADLALEPAVGLELALRARLLGADHGRAPRVVPEARCRELLVQLVEAVCERCGVKDSHGPTPGGPSTPRQRFRARSACASTQRARGSACTSCRSRTGTGRCARSPARRCSRCGAVVLDEPPLPRRRERRGRRAGRVALGAAAVVDQARRTRARSSSASCAVTSTWKSIETTSSRTPAIISSNIPWPSTRYSTSGSFCAIERRWMPSRR